MPLYSYEATDSTGRMVNGVLEAEGKSEAIERLQKERLFPVNVSVARQKPKFNLNIKLGGEAMPQRELLFFTNQMAILLKSGLELDRSLDILMELSEKEKTKETVRKIKEAVQSGDPLSSAMAKRKSAFPQLYISMVRAGETGGFLDKAFDRLAWYLESRMKLIDAVKGAMIYPAVIAVVGIIAVMVLARFVIPRFTAIFEQMGGELPLPTRIVINSSDFITNNWIAITAVIVGLLLLIRSYISTHSGKRAWDRLLLALPLIGDVIQKSGVAQFSRTLGTLLQSGVPIIHALGILKTSMSSSLMSDSMEKIIEAVKSGKRISTQMKQSKLFPQLAVQMTLIGEESGQLDEMMLRMAHIYDDEVSSAVKKMLTFLEPAMILIFGLGVTFVVVSMLVAIICINDLPF